MKKQNQSSVIKDRAHTILLRDQGKKIKEMANVLFRSETFVKESIKSYLSGGIFSVQKHHKGGNSKKLTKEEKEKLKKMLEKEPKEYGFNQSFWSIDLLKILIERQFKVVYKSNQSYQYQLQPDGKDYKVCASLESTKAQKCFTSTSDYFPSD